MLDDKNQQDFFDELLELEEKGDITLDQSIRLAEMARGSLFRANRALDIMFHINRRLEELLCRTEISQNYADKLMEADVLEAQWELLICEGVRKRIRELFTAGILCETDRYRIQDMTDSIAARRALFELPGVVEFYRQKYARKKAMEEPGALPSTGTDGE